MRMVVSAGLALLVFNLFSTVPAPPALSPRAQSFIEQVARELGSAVIVCPGREDIDPTWRCVYTKRSSAEVKRALNRPYGNDTPRQTGPWDDDGTARFTFGGSDLASASLLSGVKQRLLVWHETNP